MKIQGNQTVKGIVSVGRRVIEGFKSVLVDGNYNLVKTSEKFFRFTSQNAGTVTLPDATNMSGGFEFVFYTTSENISLLNYAGNLVQEFNPGSVYYCYLMAGGTAGGEWVISVDTSYDISFGEQDYPEKGTRLYFKTIKEYTGNLQ